MSNQEFENYVALIGKLLQLTREQREQIGGELQDHLQMRVADLMSEGVAKPDAVAKALDEFGDAAVMAKNFQTVINLKRRRWMMRFATISMAGAFLAAVLTMALWPDGARFGTPGVSLAQETEAAPTETPESATVGIKLSDATQRDLKAEEALKQVVDLSFDETPFADVAQALNEITGLNFLLDASAKDDSLTEDEPLTFNIRQLPLNKSLQLMLVEKNATYVIDEGVVVIISRDYADDASFMRLKMFDCRDLVKVLPDPPIPTILEQLNGGSPGGGHGGAGMGGDMGAGMGGGTEGGMGGLPSHDARESTLLKLVFSMVDPDGWEHTSGMASAQLVNGILVVRQKESAFRKIENLLDDLRANMTTSRIAGKVGSRKSLDSNRVPSSPGAGTASDPFGGSKTNPFTKSAKDPFSSGISGSGGDPFQNQDPFQN